MISGWKGLGTKGIKWEGTLEAEKFQGDGSALTNLPAGTETDPIFVTLSGGLAYIPTSLSGSLAYLPTTLSGSLAYIPTSLSGSLAYIPTVLSGALAYIPTSLSAALIAYATSGGASISFGSHVSDSSDPHGATLTQTTLNTNTTTGIFHQGGSFSGATFSGSAIRTTEDHTTSAAAAVVGIITSDAATPPTASTYAQGTLYIQYTA